MNRRSVPASALFAIALSLALSGCGNKGPLVLPGSPGDDTVQAETAPAETPSAETAPAESAPTGEKPPARGMSPG